ncbi:DUF4262 domain-containing protein [Blastococcus sp. URHD0036]|uniref:DUF4262 domain-containing protein n=1 Tax=Blastococcus sp. URHD0036 TaxID=1380356 RepID=UPI000495778C|nr:DUF4262 domain-containing protein [Blastococcus sp. URHD0036]
MSLDPQITAFLDQEDAHLAAVLREHRWAVQWVGPGEESGQPPFAYTIGLFGLGHPELVVSGVGPAVARGMLNWAAALVIAGRDLVPGEELSRETGGRLVVEVCPNPGEVVFGANRWYRRPDEFSVPAHQLTWPDAEGRFPWDDGYTEPPGGQARPGEWSA